MQFLKNFFKYDFVIGLCGLKKKTEATHIYFSNNFKNTFIQNTKNNYILF